MPPDTLCWKTKNTRQQLLDRVWPTNGSTNDRVSGRGISAGVRRDPSHDEPPRQKKRARKINNMDLVLQHGKHLEILTSRMDIMQQRLESIVMNLPIYKVSGYIRSTEGIGPMDVSSVSSGTSRISSALPGTPMSSQLPWIPPSAPWPSIVPSMSQAIHSMQQELQPKMNGNTRDSFHTMTGPITVPEGLWNPQSTLPTHGLSGSS